MRIRHRESKMTLKNTIVTAALTAAFVVAIPTSALAKEQVRLFVDPGHGGKDPGAVSGGLVESESNLRIAKLVEKSAKRQGWDVKMSRTKDVFVPLEKRPRLAKQWKATEFVSVHSNSTGKKTLGSMTIYRSKSGKRLGENISREVNRLTDHKDIGNVRDSRGLAVLRGAEMPATLVEVVSVSAPKERKMLKDPTFQKNAAEAIVRGVARHNDLSYVPPKDSEAEKAKARRAAEKKAAEKAKKQNADKLELNASPQASAGATDAKTTKPEQSNAETADASSDVKAVPSSTPKLERDSASSAAEKPAGSAAKTATGAPPTTAPRMSQLGILWDALTNP